MSINEIGTLVAQIESIFQLSPDSAVCVGTDGLILSWNASAARMLGYPATEAIGLQARVLIPPETQAEEFSRIRMTLSGVQVPPYETSRIRRDGSRVSVFASLTPFWSPEGRELAVLMTLRDNSAQKEVEAEFLDRQFKLGAIVAHSPSALSLKTPEGLYALANPNLQRIHHLSEEEIIGKTDFDLYPTEVATAFRKNDELVLRTMERQSVEELVPVDGEMRNYMSHMFPVKDSMGRARYVCRISLDITEPKRATHALQFSNERFSTLFHENPVATTVSRAATLEIIEANDAFLSLVGIGRDEVIGRTAIELGIVDESSELDVSWESLRDKQIVRNHETQILRRSGERRIVLATANPIDLKGESCYLSTIVDITERKAAEEKIHDLAFYDPLTRLPNRRLLYDRMGQIIAGGRRNTALSAILILDLDNFKVLNDTRGHDMGDTLLIETTRRLQAMLRESDTVARLGGDEFVVLVQDLGPDTHVAAVHAAHLGEKLRAAMAEEYAIGGERFLCSASIGVALFGSTEDSVDSVLKHADVAMYRAKEAGRNAVRFYDPTMQAALEERSSLESELRHAVDRGQLQLHYQPQVDAQGTLIGAEALLRWLHPARGSVPPVDFIPIAEETGLIMRIGAWVIESACRQIKRWSASEATNGWRVAVNVSARQFRQPDFVAQVRHTLNRTGANPESLKLEITESVVLDNVGDALGKMNELKSMGVTFSLDDFGTGHSSLSYLSKLPLDELKIDRSFVLNLPGNANDVIIAQTIITMATSLGLRVIAEGVETEAQRAFLEANGCCSFQGYLFGRPVPAQEFERQVAILERTPATVSAGR